MKIVRNSIYNFLGLALPLVVGLGTIPVLISELGTARFGLLTLIWAVVSYFGLFDMGLGRALTQRLAMAIADDDDALLKPLITTASVVLLMLGILAGFLMAALGPAGVDLMKSVPDKEEATNAVYLMAIALPAIVLTAGLRGALESVHAFGTINAIRFTLGLVTFLGPLAVVIFGAPRLDWIASVLVLARIAGVVFYTVAVYRRFSFNWGNFGFSRSLIVPLCVSGSWISVSNIISPLMGYADRFLIGTIISAEAVAYYATPNEIVTKIWIIPGALTAVLFPTFAAHGAQKIGMTRELFDRAVHWLFVILLPIALTLCLFSFEILSLWVGSEFASQSATLLQIFSIGILVNSLAHVPFTLIQGMGAARLTALIHVCMFPIYIPVLWWATTNFGSLGTATAWLLRILIDMGLMFAVSSRFIDRHPTDFLGWRSLGLALLGAAAFSGAMLEPVGERVIVILLATGISALTLTFSNPSASRNTAEH